MAECCLIGNHPTTDGVATDGSAALGDLGSEPGLDRIPMVVLGGCLGSGKTTLLNRFLRASGGERLATRVLSPGVNDLT
jgi:tRNA A37 threonylcarbamoyladenosine biosynthesis protein TsaE|tara:strand:- start:195 stop:431 length:237 start_codon:yes stop_codon:yes gene_type:complete